jgi:hypothetical protein
MPQLRANQSYNDIVDRILDGGPAADVFADQRTSQAGGKLSSPQDSANAPDVVRGILWPHDFIHRTGQSGMKHDHLTLPELVAGVTKILLCNAVPQSEKDARLRHLRDLMYLARKYQWPAVRCLYGAVLDDVRKGLRSWEDPIGSLEGEMLSPTDLLSRSSGGGAGATPIKQVATAGSPGPAKAQVCRKWNYEECPREQEGKVCYYAHKCHSCFMYRHVMADHKASTCPARLAYLKTKAAAGPVATSAV